MKGAFSGPSLSGITGQLICLSALLDRSSEVAASS